jgi:zinc transport system ATP-binding protein
MLLSLENITVQYGAKRALDSVSMEVQEGDFLTIVGPNGAGKTTLLRILLGLERATDGTVKSRGNLRIGYVPQRLPLNPNLPMHVARFLRMGEVVSAAALAKVAEQTRITEILDHAVASLSGGEMQRVLLARALLRSPQLLVLDEPAQNLDIASQMEFYALLDSYHKESGCAVVMVSHDLHLVMARTTRVLCLFRHICCQGTPKSVAEDPIFARTMGADVAALLAAYSHKHDHAHTHDHPHTHDCDGHDHATTTEEAAS